MIILDVREPYEVASGTIPGSRNISWGQLSQRLGDLDKTAHYVTICNHGNRSTRAMQLLERSGFEADVLVGGVSAWSHEGREVVRAAPGEVRTLGQLFIADMWRKLRGESSE